MCVVAWKARGIESTLTCWIGHGCLHSSSRKFSVRPPPPSVFPRSGTEGSTASASNSNLVALLLHLFDATSSGLLYQDEACFLRIPKFVFAAELCLLLCFMLPAWFSLDGVDNLMITQELKVKDRKVWVWVAILDTAKNSGVCRPFVGPVCCIVFFIFVRLPRVVFLLLLAGCVWRQTLGYAGSAALLPLLLAEALDSVYQVATARYPAIFLWNCLLTALVSLLIPYLALYCCYDFRQLTAAHEVSVCGLCRTAKDSIGF